MVTRSAKIYFTHTLLVFVLFTLSASALAQGGGVKGQVRAPNGKGIPNAVVTVRRDGKDIKATTSDSNGDFAITGLEEGKYNIAFDVKGYSLSVLYGVEVRKSIRSLGNRPVLTVDRGTLVLIHGYVFSKNGLHLPAAKVHLEQVNSDGSTKVLASTYSNTFGEFAFRRPEGAAKLRVTAKLNGVSGSKDLEVEGAAIYRVAVSLGLDAGSNSVRHISSHQGPFE